jgi:hypothetical protein
MRQRPIDLREYVDLKFQERDKALVLQFTEYGRRLADLNHEHARAVAVQQTYVTQEKFEDFVKRFEEYREVTSKALTLAEGTRAGSGELVTRGLAILVGVGVLADLIARITGG